MHPSPRTALAFLALAVIALVGVSGSPPLWAEDSAMPESVDQIKGVGKFKFGQHLKDFPVGILQPVDPKASGILLRVSPYGDNYLVPNVTGLTWGDIPVTGLVLTFHEGVLIEFQLALKAMKKDFYVADRAFKDKYGPSNPRTFPVETWSGADIQVTLIFSGLEEMDANSVDASVPGKVEMFDQGRWNKFEALRTAKLRGILNREYRANASKVKANL